MLLAAEDLCGDPLLPESMQATMSMIRRNIGLEARLINDLLDLTRIANGKLALREQESEAHSLIGLAVEIVRDDAQAKGIGLDLELAALHTRLMCDPARLQQVFWNLLKNAIKFTPAGGRIAVRSLDHPGSVAIEVIDTGIGLSAEALGRIFLPFEQAGLANDHRFGGLGLGLAIAKAIVEMHGGTIVAESPGLRQGATFRVQLPSLERSLGITEPARPEPTASLEAPVSEGRPLRLLLVEDHEPTLTVLTRLLTRAGHTIAAASSVAAARTLAGAQTFDAVISDLGLPDGTGIELMEHLQAHHGLRGIALSGYGMEEDLRRSREVGFVTHLVKPVDFAQLRHALAHL